jgi:hypothetical protein
MRPHRLPSPRTTAFVRHLPVAFVAANATICLPLSIWEIYGTVHHWHMGDQLDGPIILLLLVNFPASLFAQSIAGCLDINFGIFRNLSDTAGAVEWCALLLAAGLVWYYLLGRGLRWLILRFRQRRQAVQGFPVVQSCGESDGPSV